MYVAKIPNRGSPPAILLRESYREDGKVKNRTLANLSHWPENRVAALSDVLKGLSPKSGLEGTFEISRSLPHGHVAAVLGTLRLLGLEELIDSVPSHTRSFISMNWRGRPLVSYRTIIELISATTTQKGLTIKAQADTNVYQKGIKISDKELAALPLERHEFHGDWNYTIA